MTESRLPRDDIAAAMAARRELGPEYDDAFVDAVVARLHEAMDVRPAAPAPAPPRPSSGDRGVTSLQVFSIVAAIPLTGIAAGTSGLPGLIVAWVGLVLLNVAFALRRP
ncbi:hypothetical protein [Thermomonospora umbrina]|uniref:Uncharacterized protein n=1 Tax=Thermomonospora umbrina TaxID=111806 RepID=A0A3D9SZ11_9ACTN|nr:hypothetical protein [Thermomonospora umbrina]REF01180.1 hypothetical protein DFJ69_6780 [Thermomonospora umbrina]